MKKTSGNSIPVIIGATITLLVFFCFTMGCTQTPQENPQPAGDIGVTTIVPPPEEQKVDFETAVNSVTSYPQGGEPQFHIYSIMGINLDKNGNADSWLFVAKQGAINRYIEYNKAGVSVDTWNDVISGPEISLYKIVTPDALFQKNEGLIQSNMPAHGALNLVLQNNTYELTGNKTSLRFNALTGTPVS